VFSNAAAADFSAWTPTFLLGRRFTSLRLSPKSTSACSFLPQRLLGNFPNRLDPTAYNNQLPKHSLFYQRLTSLGTIQPQVKQMENFP